MIAKHMKRTERIEKVRFVLIFNVEEKNGDCLIS